MALSQQEAEGILLKGAIKKYQELRMPTTHLLGYFPTQTYDTTEIPIEVQRDRDLVAVDVLRGTNGNSNNATKSSLKIIVPPFYHEKFSINALRNYERAFGVSASTAPASNRVALANEVAIQLQKIQNKIIRAQEIQCAQALELGVVTLKNGDSIDYLRNADSLVDNSATPWTTTTTDVESQLQTAIEFISQVGGNTTGVYDMTMSGQAWVALQKTDFFTKKANYNKVTLLAIGNPTNRNGATYHGQITAGSAIFNIWTYDATYLNASGVRTRITDQTKVVIVPVEGLISEMAYGAVDTIVKSAGATSLSGVQIEKAATDFYVWDNLDRNNLVHEMHLTSAPIARLITVDQVYTMKIAVSFTSGQEG
jgi:hypothetical protein